MAAKKRKKAKKKECLRSSYAYQYNAQRTCLGTAGRGVYLDLTEYLSWSD